MSAAPKEPHKEPRKEPTPLRALPAPRMARPDSYAPEAEQAILAALCENNALAQECGALAAHPEWFSLPNRGVAEVVLSMIAHGEDANFISILDEARRRKEEVADELSISDLSESLSRLDITPSPPAVHTLASQVMRAAKERLIFQWTEKATGLSLAGSEDELERLIIERRELLAQFDDINEKQRFAFMTDSEVEQMTPPQWLISDTLVEDTISMIFGEFGSAKSFLTLDFALCIATGTPWLGHAVKQGSVAYIAGEGIGGMGKRIRAWKSHHHWTGASDLFLLGDPPQLLQEGDVAALLASLHALPASPAMVVIDTLARSLVGGNENDQQDMGVAVANAEIIRREFNCHVLIVHHSPWDGKRPRGSTALPGAVSTSIAVGREDKAITVECYKQREFDMFKDIPLILHTVALDEHADETSCVLIEPDTTHSIVRPNRKPQTPRSELAVLEYFNTHAYGAAGDIVSALAPMARSTVNLALRSLIEQGVVSYDRGIYRLVMSD